ncbi:MAG: hypothetical protein F8N37_06745 [Telmatospirillum sp.]|nr:hypothetical protein [Telmatospirillum sp.]
MYRRDTHFLIRLCLALCFLLPGTQARADNPFGLMLWPNGHQDLPFVAARARGLGVAWFRPPAVVLDHWQKPAGCPACEAPARAGLKVALTVRNDGRDHPPRRPSQPPSDWDAFRGTLTGVIEAWKPALLVVENEENNPQSYKAGPTPEDLAVAYGKELEQACAVAHAHAIACANGGLSGDAAAGYTWLALLQLGQTEKACSFARKAFYTEEDRNAGAALCAYRTTASVPADVRTALLRGADVLIPVYARAPIDRVNIHWYGRDADAFAIVADILVRATGKPVMSNEIGQWRWDSNPVSVRPLLRAAFASGVNPAIWYSLDTASTVSLLNEDGSLRPAGEEFVRQMSGRR